MPYGIINLISLIVILIWHIPRSNDIQGFHCEVKETCATWETGVWKPLKVEGVATDGLFLAVRFYWLNCHIDLLHSFKLLLSQVIFETSIRLSRWVERNCCPIWEQAQIRWPTNEESKGFLCDVKETCATWERGVWKPLKTEGFATFENWSFSACKILLARSSFRSITLLQAPMLF